MRKSIIALVFAVIAFVVPFSISAAVAAAPTSQSIAVFHPGDEKTFAVGKDLFTLRNFTNAVSKDTSGDFSVAEIMIAPQYGTGFLLQKHVTDVERDIYALGGKFEIFGFQRNKTIKVSSGDFIHIPAGMPYAIKNVGSEPGRILFITTSKGFENFIEEIGTPVADKSSVPSNPVEPSMEKVASVAHKYGIDFLN